MFRAARLSLYVLLVCLMLGCTESEKYVYTQNVDNIIIIAIDTLRANHCGFMGYDRETSPFLDEFSERCVVFNRAYCPKALTLPSFTCLFSGLHTVNNKIYKNMWPLAEDLHMLTEDFQSSGFHTIFSSASAILDSMYRMDQGFDEYLDADPHTEWAERTVEKAQGIIDSAEQPMFIAIHFWEPHSPYDPNPEALALFSDPDYEGPMDGSIDVLNAYNLQKIELDSADIQHAIDRYDADVRWLDERLRGLFDYFEEKGLIDNSIIIILSDHGERLGEGHIFQHRRDTTVELHIPLMFHFPGDVGAGTRIPAMVEITDVLPTVMDILGIPIPKGIDGMSLLPLVVDPTREHRTKLLSVGFNDPGYFLYSEYDGRRRVRIPAPVEEPEPHWLDSQSRERLRALGYIR